MDWILLLDQAVIPVIVAIVAPILLVLAKKAVDIFQEKTGLEVSYHQRMLLDDFVRQGIDFAEEQAHKAAKKGLKTPAGDTKLELAIEYISTHAKPLGIDRYPDELAQLIEAKLYENRPGIDPIVSGDATEEAVFKDAPPEE